MNFEDLTFNSRSATRISSNNIIQAPLIFSSDQFKIRKLNPNKLYKALQAYYADSSSQEINLEELKKKSIGALTANRDSRSALGSHRRSLKDG